MSIKDAVELGPRNPPDGNQLIIRASLLLGTIKAPAKRAGQSAKTIFDPISSRAREKEGNSFHPTGWLEMVGTYPSKMGNPSFWVDLSY
ncbi:hypothetical protein HJFPF1_07767 [Paramyrothecium foliicola]|nr:hypothetical protein HJFPF1_07767 [Paramyrothecium foliicola]